MPNYRYTARTERGAAVTGTLAARSPEALADELKRMGYLVTQSRELAQRGALAGFAQRLGRVPYDDLVLLNVQLSKMVRVGIPLVSALDTLAGQTPNSRLRAVMAEVARSVESGTSFSEALERHPAIFSVLFVSMVRAGELSGKLDEILRRLAAFAKHQAALRQQLATAMTYPVVLLVVGIAVMTFLVMGIIPKFMKIFLEAHVALPAPTLWLYTISQALRRYGIVLLGLVVACGAGLRWYVRTPGGRRLRDAALLRIPVVGDLARQAGLSRLARTLETLFSSGVPVLESLAIAEQTCGNTVLADACRSAQASVKRGGTISEPFQASRQVPPMVVQMIRVGETSGTLDQMLGEIAEHYDELVGHGLKRVTALIEPLFLIVLGGLVAFIMASILLPLFRMVNVIK
jgi:type IV pilus assembly protein PilC